jgi:Uma2 family endonuclease
VPDLCEEVISPNDIYLDVDEKVRGYLNDGVRIVWVVNPRSKAVNVHASGGMTPLDETGTLDGGDLLPDFSLPVSALFPA